MLLCVSLVLKGILGTEVVKAVELVGDEVVPIVV